jgi:preprotein translocase subunit SecA
MVKDGKILIVDEFTGRLMPGRRWSDGIHQAIEAKEGVTIENENQTLATITFQNFFRMYDKLGGMTGTADTEAAEFAEIYNLEVLVIPPNRPMIRMDYGDQIYNTAREKYEAIVNEIAACHEKGQPTLVGTISIEKSELLASMLAKRKIRHNVLNAKYHEKEAEIVAQAGRKGAVTIATNMAGRGTDIILGGNPEMLLKGRGMAEGDDGYGEALAEMRAVCAAEHEEVLAAGGLHIIGTERHESRRIDNQLRGRSGRQGDPGSSRFFLSLEDDLMRIFGGDKIQGLMNRLGMEEGEPIEAKLVTRAIENSQRKVEGHNFDIRKQLLEYDDVMNKQREVIYDQRGLILAGEELEETVLDMARTVLDDQVDTYAPASVDPEEWDMAGLAEAMSRHFAVAVAVDAEKNLRLSDGTPIDFATVTREPLSEALEAQVVDHFARRKAEIGEKLWGDIEKYITLQVLDNNWKDHLLTMDHLKEGIGLRGFAQKNPLNEYKKEGMGLFSAMIDRIRTDSVGMLAHTQVKRENEAALEQRQREREAEAQRKMIASHGGDVPPESQTVRRDGEKVGRNDPCPCGSGKKYKKCHGAAANA